ncbi:hypothetical protein GBA63_19260 [Rubrobacter tropicus]|uniref:YoaR-like putative peptidoglycan binding domain-containing protein n=1 Tax=Rubrobacter tropicus TaxID=2653851 RepID=A0A6G8QDR8_9ACTN|nr:peptidoglycan binding domain-containing protein [Rubrobacter tropicus]QIN84541.1 hypothetical protein GBA63_19260 [Rubrobacter tropicus]
MARAVAGPTIVLCAIFAVLVAADTWSSGGEIYPGVFAGSVDLGGMTPGEAEKLLGTRAVGSAGIRLVGPGEIVLEAGQMGARLDVAQTADRAYAVGRTGGFFERLGDRGRAFFGTAVEPAVAYDPGSVRAAVEDASARLAREPRPASVEVRNSEVEVVAAREGYSPDVGATAENVGQAIGNLRDEARLAGEVLEPEVSTSEAEAAAAQARRAMSEEVLLTSGGRRWELSPAEIGRSLDFAPADGALRVTVDRDALKENLSAVYAALEERPVEADYEVNGTAVTVTPGREGRRIEEEKLFGALEDGLSDGERRYAVTTVVSEPEFTTAEARKMRPTQKLGSYRTNYSIVQDSGARVDNLAMSSGAITGTLLAPGETFSMNDTVSGLDYNATKVIVDGQEALADGGGLCQVTSTLYNAVNEAGLDVTERSPHYAQLPYIRPGLDATVWFGDEQGNGELDMEFENTSKGYVLLREYVADDGYIYAEVWGVPDDVDVQTWSEPVYRNADSARWVTYQTYREGGKVLYDGVLHRDTYEALKDKKGKPIPADTVPVAPVDP